MNYLDQPEKYPFAFRLFIRPMIGRHLDSMFVMEQFLEKECQDLDYTIVRPPRLLDDPMIGKFEIQSIWIIIIIVFYLEKEVKVYENDYFFPDHSTAGRIPRANVARFMLDILKDEKYIRQGVAVDMPEMMEKSD
jgi:hypothetical protein